MFCKTNSAFVESFRIDILNTLCKKLHVQCNVLQVEYNTFCAAGMRESPVVAVCTLLTQPL